MEMKKETAYKAVYYITITYIMLISLAVIVWSSASWETFIWPTDNTEANTKLSIHAILMILGVVSLLGINVINSNILRSDSNILAKISYHTGCFVSLLMAIGGLVMAFLAHGDISPPVKHMYSLHSWLGLLCVIMLAIQVVSGLVVFNVPNLQSNLPTFFTAYLCMGMIAFSGAAAVALLGLTNRALTAIPKYSKFCGAGVGINFAGIAIVVMVGLVFYLVLDEEFKNFRPAEHSFSM